MKKTSLVALDGIDQLFSYLGPQYVMPESDKDLLEIYKDAVEHSLVFEVFLTEDAVLEGLLRSTSAFLEAGLFFDNDVLGLLVSVCSGWYRVLLC